MEDLDDLFNEGLNDQLNGQLEGQIDDRLNEQLNTHLGLPAAPRLQPGLAERVDELRLSGCCTRIAWSRMGSLAYITADLRDVRVCNLRFSRSSGTWEPNRYTDPSLSDALPRIFRPPSEIVHLAWNPIGTELLIADSAGWIAFCAIWLAVNRLVVVRLFRFGEAGAVADGGTSGPGAAGGDADSLNALVELKWLSHARPVSIGHGAAKAAVAPPAAPNGHAQDQRLPQTQWKYAISQHEARGPHSPWGKAAFIGVTRARVVRLCYQGLEDYHDVKYELDGISSSRDLLTHASVCPDKGETMLLAVHSASRQVRLYTVTIDWHLPKNSQEPPTNLASLNLQHITILDVCAPSIETIGVQTNGFMSPPIEPALTHLELVSRRPDTRVESAPLVPTMLAIFSRVPTPSAHAPAPEAPYSIMSRWELRTEKPALDPAFMQLGNKKHGELREEDFFEQLDDERRDGTILSVQQTQPGVLAFAYSDGTVDFRDGKLSTLSPDDKPGRVTSLQQLGFNFLPSPCLHVALSANAVLRASFAKITEPEFAYATYQMQQSDLDETLDKIAAAFVLQITVAETSINVGGNTDDDLLATIHNFARTLPPNTPHRRMFEARCVRDVYRMLAVVDKLDDSSFEKLMRFPLLHRCLSLQAALGYDGDEFPRPLPSRLASVLLTLRNIALSFGLAIMPRAPPNSANGAELEINKPEVLQYMTGLVAWIMNFIDFVVDQLYELCRDLDLSASADIEPFRTRIQEGNNIVVFIILSTVIRNFLRHCCRGLKSLATQSVAPMAQPPSPLAPLYSTLGHVVRSCIIPPPKMDNVLTKLEELLRAAYSSLTTQQKQELELRLLVEGVVPEPAIAPLRALLAGVVDGMRRYSPEGEAELAFKDWGALSPCLGLEDARSRRWAREHVLDELRKVILPVVPASASASGTPTTTLVPGGRPSRLGIAGTFRLRRCTRCAGAMEDIIPSRTFRQHWLMNLMRMCVCGAHWFVENEPGPVATVVTHDASSVGTAGRGGPPAATAAAPTLRADGQGAAAQVSATKMERSSTAGSGNVKIEKS